MAKEHDDARKFEGAAEADGRLSGRPGLAGQVERRVGGAAACPTGVVLQVRVVISRPGAATCSPAAGSEYRMVRRGRRTRRGRGPAGMLDGQDVLAVATAGQPARPRRRRCRRRPGRCARGAVTDVLPGLPYAPGLTAVWQPGAGASSGTASRIARQFFGICRKACPSRCRPYMALCSRQHQGVTDDSWSRPVAQANLARRSDRGGPSSAGYAEGWRDGIARSSAGGSAQARRPRESRNVPRVGQHVSARSASSRPRPPAAAHPPTTWCGNWASRASALQRPPSRPRRQSSTADSAISACRLATDSSVSPWTGPPAPMRHDTHLAGRARRAARERICPASRRAGWRDRW